MLRSSCARFALFLAVALLAGPLHTVSFHAGSFHAGSFHAGLFPTALHAQTQPTAGIERRDARVDALVGARIITGAGRELVGTVLLRDGRIEAVGENIEIPPEARMHDLAGRVITAGWIELDLPVPVRAAGNDDDARVARAWNPRVHPELDAVLALPLAENRTQELRKIGFTLAVIAPEEGIFAGTGALVGLGSASDAPGGDGELRTTVVRDRVGMFAKLEHGGGPQRSYPSSRMGDQMEITGTPCL